MMTGRGRLRKAERPDTECAKSKTRPEETKQASLSTCPIKDFAEERQNGTTKEQKPKEKKRANCTEEKPPVQSAQKDKTTRHFTEAPVQGTNARTCSGSAKTTEQSAEEITKMQTGRPKDTTKDSLKTTKAKTCGRRAKSPEDVPEEMTKKQPQAPKDTTKDSLKTTKAKTCGRRAKSPEDVPEEMTKKQPQAPQDTTKDSLKTTKAKTCGRRAKSPEDVPEAMTKKQPQAPKDTTKDSLKTTKAKTCGRRAKSPEDVPEAMTKKQPQAPKDTTKDSLKTTKAKTCGRRAKSPEDVPEEMTKKQPQAPKDTTKDSLKTTKAKTCGRRAKSPEDVPEAMTKKQPQAPKDTTKDSLKTTKAKTCGRRAKSPEDVPEEMTKKQPQAPKDTTKDSLKTTKAKTCGRRAKSPEDVPEEMAKMQPQAPQDTTKASMKTTKGKKHGGRAKSPEDVPEGMAKMQPQAPKDTTKDSMKTTKGKTRGRRAKSQDKFAEGTTKTNPQTPKDPTKACVPKDRCEDNTAVDSLLRTTLEKLKIKRNERADAAEVINRVINNIITHLKEKTQCFKEVEALRTGSYYENLKIFNPDEFDVMLPIPVDRVDIKPFGDDGAFYSVALKRGKSPLQKFQENGTLSASKMLEEFREEVKKSVKECREWKVTKKKKGCPAVTLTTELQSVAISLDVVLSIGVKSRWPPFTEEGLKIEGWLGAKVKQEHKRKPYYLVPKYEGRGTVENDGVLAKDIWRVSFSHIEKDILRNHGSEKTCCEKGGASCCRKDCLKLLKHLLSLLKEKDSSFDKFCSYHAKTTLLHACCSRTKDSDWKASSLSHCFQLLLEDFVAHLEGGVLGNFFIPAQNLLAGPGRTMCNNLARCIREEGDKGFPIFRKFTTSQQTKCL